MLGTDKPICNEQGSLGFSPLEGEVTDEQGERREDLWVPDYRRGPQLTADTEGQIEK